MIVLHVIGNPQPQGNKTAFHRGGRTVVVEGRTKEARTRFHDWRTAVAEEARRWQEGHGHGLLEGPVLVELTFFMTRPASHPKRRRTWATSRPDIDKLARSILDALTGVVLTNDSQVVGLLATKDWDDPPGVQVVVRPLDGDAAIEGSLRWKQLDPVYASCPMAKGES